MTDSHCRRLKELEQATMASIKHISKIKWGSSPAIPIVAVIWLCIVVGLTIGMMQYANAPGQAGTLLTKWPTNTNLVLHKNEYTLLMFAHPRCPCTRASMGELEVLMTHCQNRITGYVVFVLPTGTDSNWTETDLVHSAKQIPGIKVKLDHDGQLAQQFGSLTSGTTFVFDDSGMLRFHGGITLARGHSGDNPGRSSIEQLVAGKPMSMTSTPVFGCALIDSVCLAGVTE
jgi:hypothetical protein